jgi:uncharacterized cupredoxin-like copper-binding protein
MRTRLCVATALVLLAAAATACSSEAASSAPSPEAGIATTLTDFKIQPAETEALAGPVTFDLTNDGPSDHSFYVVRTDLPEDQLPVTDHVVDLNQLEVVGQIDKVEFDTQRSLTVDLEPGSYVMFCNLTGHYESDMHTAFTVT